MAHSEFLRNMGQYRNTIKIKNGLLFPKEAALSGPITTAYIPGRITQRTSATVLDMDEYDNYYLEQLHWNEIYPPKPSPCKDEEMPKWVDVSQFEFNPQFIDLFDFDNTSGIAEITLPPWDLAGWYNVPDISIDCLNSHFVTQPPVVSLNVGTWIPQLYKPRARKLLHIVNVKNEGGIRTGELVSALKQASALAIEHWLYWAEKLRTAVDEVHWNQDIWVVEKAPKLLLSLDPYAVDVYAIAPSAHWLWWNWCIMCLMRKHNIMDNVNTEFFFYSRV
ncbi:hypothetical protein P154DRAFT_538713 [Amniculicola lignicola CBS 123094]|uniref:Uncharacterized protein n=1 Tax=Amniculicola lignicola CBS 123094 TaxID=1392246 RepID=A0A6A5W8Y1_9PLEO|nr:hypothetical protein P154DRAFT_538713 [Amniculicola lignicola CBS 123094]